jgi:hypothetical protein
MQNGASKKKIKFFRHAASDICVEPLEEADKPYE